MNRRQFVHTALVSGLFWPMAGQADEGDLPGFNEAASAGLPILVHVTATWCEVCQIQKLIVARLLTLPDFKDMKKFDVDFDRQKPVLRRHRVQMQSTMVVYKGVKEVGRLVGQTNPAAIETLLRKAL